VLVLLLLDLAAPGAGYPHADSLAAIAASQDLYAALYRVFARAVAVEFALHDRSRLVRRRLEHGDVERERPVVLDGEMLDRLGRYSHPPQSVSQAGLARRASGSGCRSCRCTTSRPSRGLREAASSMFA
jgi:hypothetical protein